MNKIVREHYPVERLPEDLRGGLEGQATVTVTLEQEADQRNRDFAQQKTTLFAAIAEARASIKGPGVTSDEAVARVRALRDEWDDR
jgi:hypothetical protein